MVMSRSILWPRRMPASNRAPMMSPCVSSMDISTRTPGYSARNGWISGENPRAVRIWEAERSTARRRVPIGLSRNELTLSTAWSMPSRIGWTSARSRSPASVSATLRVVRLNNLTPSPSSSRDRMVWLHGWQGYPHLRRRLGEAAVLGDGHEGGQFGQLNSGHSSQSPMKLFRVFAVIKTAPGTDVTSSSGGFAAAFGCER